MVSSTQLIGHVALVGLAAVTQAQELRLMPLGASITNGEGSTSGNGYRGSLSTMLSDAGYSTDFVGSLQTGDMEDPDNEGHRGKHISEVQAIAEENVPNYQPNLYCINVGTNDAREDDDLDNAGARMDSLVQYLWEETPDATIILSTLVRHRDEETDERFIYVSDQLMELAEKLAGEGAHILIADMHGENGPQVDDLNDDFHPSDAGYHKMAGLWFEKIEEAKENGWLGE